MLNLKSKKVMLYVTGSVAAYKSVVLLRLLQKSGAEVRVAMTKAATRFVQPLTFEALGHQSVLLDGNDGLFNRQIVHIEAAQWPDMAIVAPATANIIAKLSNGIADDIVTTTFLATNVPKFVVPAMNDQMWANSATQRNIQQLSNDGIQVLAPDTGQLAEGYSGQGRMMEPAMIINQLTTSDDKLSQPLLGKKVLVTAGGTQEAIDPVRFITNRSSGKMGYAIAKTAAEWGAEVTLISGPTKLAAPKNVKVVNVVSTTDMANVVLKHFPNHDILVMSAAVADFMVADPHPQKIKKHSGQTQITLTFQMAPDILKAVAKIKNDHQYVVGFAAETNDLLQNAQKKLLAKHLNMLVANDVSNKAIGFNSNQNQVTFLKPNQPPVQTQQLDKAMVAQQLWQQVIKDLKRGH